MQSRAVYARSKITATRKQPWSQKGCQMRIEIDASFENNDESVIFFLFNLIANQRFFFPDDRQFIQNTFALAMDDVELSDATCFKLGALQGELDRALA